MNKKLEELSNKNIVKMSNDLCSARYNISEVSLNIFLMLLTEIRMEDEELFDFDISLIQIEKKLNKRLNRSPKKLDEIKKDLTGKNLCLANSTEFIPFCTQFEYIKEDGVNFVSIKINPELTEELLNLTQQFTNFNLSQLIQLKGLYTKRMYMILYQVSGMKRWKVPLEKLHSILILPESYTKRFDYMKSRVLNPAMQQINQLNKKEIEASYTIDKRGSRKVKLLNFKVEKTEEKRKRINKYSSAKKQKEREESRNKELWRQAINGELYPEEKNTTDEDIYNDFYIPVASSA